MDAHRSGCPINLTLEILGDKWSLLIIRDIIFGNRRHFRALLNRLKTLLAEGVLTKSDDPTHRQKALYSLTEKGIALLPVLAQMAVWGRAYTPVSEELSIRAELLEEGGPRLWAEFMEELRERHLGIAPARRRRGSSVLQRMQAAYEAVMARKRGGL